MGAYLPKPKTEKISSDESNDYLICGASAMQGWRQSQEVNEINNSEIRKTAIFFSFEICAVRAQLFSFSIFNNFRALCNSPKIYKLHASIHQLNILLRLSLDIHVPSICSETFVSTHTTKVEVMCSRFL